MLWVKIKQQTNLYISGRKIIDSMFKYKIICFLRGVDGKCLYSPPKKEKINYGYRTFLGSIYLNFIKLLKVRYLMPCNMPSCSQEVCTGLTDMTQDLWEAWNWINSWTAGKIPPRLLCSTGRLCLGNRTSPKITQRFCPGSLFSLLL